MLVATLALVAAPGRAADAGTPRREDRSALIVLHLYGSYYDMGRQQAELLGPVARRMYEYHRAKYTRVVAHGDWRLRLIDWGIAPLSWIGPWYEESGFFDELHGIADGLGVPRADLLRAVMATSFGSTVFAATGRATADGGAIIGRNVDWSDGDGVMRPVVLHCHPDNGDLAYVAAGWPLVGAPTVGINAAGFALSFNFFVVDETVGVPPRMRERRALQTARTVEDGIRTFTEVSTRAMPTFMVMADASGAIAMVECTPSACAAFRPDGDWFAQANHARTEAMIPFDRYRSPDSFRRRAAMEEAVRTRLGAITPAVAAEIIRDRANSPYVNDSTVANLYVLNAAVLHPASKTLWHSTAMQPLAPFGEMVPFSVGADVSNTPVLPADARLGTPATHREAAVVGEARTAVRFFTAGRFAEAQTVWDALARHGAPFLQPDRLAYGRAAARLQQGALDDADARLAEIDPARAPFEVAAASSVLRAVIADRQGRRDDAIRFFQLAQTTMDRHPEYTDRFTGALRAAAGAGLAGPLGEEDLPALPDFQYVPE